MEDSIIVLSSEGTIICAYENWKEMVTNNILNPKIYSERTNYLKVCDKATGNRSDEAAALAKGIRDVINGRLKRFKLEFPSQDADNTNCFLIKVQPLSQNYPTGVILQYVDITEREKIEIDKIESEKHLHSILNNLQLVGVMLDLNGNIIFCNDFLLDLTGRKREDVLGKSWFDIFLPADITSKIKTFFLKTIETADFPSYYENEIVTKDGHKRMIAWNNTVLKDRNGNISSITSIGEDRTYRRFAENSLLNSKGQLRTLVDTIPDLVWLKDQNGIFLMCNSKFERFYAAKEAQIVGKTDYDFVDKELADFFTQNDRRAIAAGKPTINEEWITYTDDGHREYLETIKSPMYDSNGHLIGVLGVGRDITRRKLDKEELQRREMQLRTAQKVGGFGSWEFDLNSRMIDISEETFRIYGLKTGHYTIEDVQKVPLPEYRSMLDTALKHLVEGKSPYDVQFKIMRQNDGEICDIHSVAEYFVEQNIIMGTIHDITELKQIENKLRGNEALLNEVGRIAKIGGWELDIASGKATLTPEVKKINETDEVRDLHGGFDRYPPGSREIIIQAINDAIEKRKPYDIELEFISAKGTHKWVRAIGHPLINDDKVVKLYGTLQDITERKQTELKIAEEATKRRILIEQSSDGIVVLDQNGKVYEVNQKFADMLGYSLEEALQLHLWDWDTQWTREELLEIIEHVNEFGDHFETRHRCKDGTFIDVEISSNGTMFGEQKLVFCVCRNITERKQAEDMLLHAKLAAEDANKSKGEFLSTMSHELRTPLNSIIGFSDMLLDGAAGNLNEKQTRYTNNISTGGKHLLELINDILDLSKIDAGKMELHYESFPVSEAIDEVKMLVVPLALKKKIEIDFKIDSELGSINADNTKFKQILYNLASNAIKFTPEKGYVDITAHRIGNMLEISVIDNGIGIATKDLHKLFQPFQQLNSYMTREHEGTGLGLILVKKYVEMHGGNIWVESEVGKGSIFTFTIPYC
ncbi:PAS domain S-box protein [uncultured Methanomethylovorans sp.]|uniref:PAS domain S-box protein n=1 Tax=uncultured Methanomethylovorans sp. TaxID=183759 RepID=UPI003748BDD2